MERWQDFGVRLSFGLHPLRFDVLGGAPRVGEHTSAICPWERALQRKGRPSQAGAGNASHRRRGGGGLGMTPGCVAVCCGRRLLASRHLPLPFP